MEDEKTRKLTRRNFDEDDGAGALKKVRIGGLEVEEAMKKIVVRVNEVIVEWERAESEENLYLERAWDDVKGGELKIEDVKQARGEEVSYMVKN